MLVNLIESAVCTAWYSTATFHPRGHWGLAETADYCLKVFVYLLTAFTNNRNNNFRIIEKLFMLEHVASNDHILDEAVFIVAQHGKEGNRIY